MQTSESREMPCSICGGITRNSLKLRDGYLCEQCETSLPWEIKTMRFSKGIGMDNKYAEKLIISKLEVGHIKEAIAFCQGNKALWREFEESHFIPECGMAVDYSKGLFYFDVSRGNYSEPLKNVLLNMEGEPVMFHSSMIESYFLDYAYFRETDVTGNLVYSPMYAQIVLTFRHPVLKNKSIRLDAMQNFRAELLMRNFYREYASYTLEMLQALTGFAPGPEGKTYYN